MDAPIGQETIDLALSDTAQKWLRAERIRRLAAKDAIQKPAAEIRVF